MRLAGEKAKLWYLRQHSKVMRLPFREGLTRPDRDNAIDSYLRDDMTPPERADWLSRFAREPERLTADERREWLASLDGVSLASDGLFPFRDNVDVASTAGVRYIAQPGGSKRGRLVQRGLRRVRDRDGDDGAAAVPPLSRRSRGP